MDNLPARRPSPAPLQSRFPGVVTPQNVLGHNCDYHADFRISRCWKRTQSERRGDTRPLTDSREHLKRYQYHLERLRSRSNMFSCEQISVHNDNFNFTLLKITSDLCCDIRKPTPNHYQKAPYRLITRGPIYLDHSYSIPSCYCIYGILLHQFLQKSRPR